MEGTRTHRVKLDVMSKTQFAMLVLFATVILALSCITGALGPDHTVSRAPSTTHGTQIDILNEPCNSDVNNQVIDSIPRCWHHWFQFNKKWTQFFDWELAVSRPVSQSTFAASYTLTANVLWQGSPELADSSSPGDWSTVANSSVTRTITCASGAVECDSVILFRTNVVDYKTYFFQINLPDHENGDPIDHSFIDSVDFVFKYRNASFAQYEVGFKVLFSVLTVFVLGLYSYASKDATNIDLNRKQGIRWMKTLLVSVLLFNNPGFPLSFLSPSVFLVWLSTIFQITFLCILLMFLLVEFAMLASDQRTQTFAFFSFYLPKLLFIGAYWVVAIGLYSWVVFKQQQDPLYDWFVDDQMLHAIQITGGLMAALYILTLAYLIVRSSIVSVCKSSSSSDRFIYSIHMFVLAIAVSGIAFGVVVGIDVRHAFDFLFFHAVFNIYIYLLAYLYLPLEEVQFSQIGGADGASAAAPSADSPRRLEEGESEYTDDVTRHTSRSALMPIDSSPEPDDMQYQVGSDSDDEEDDLAMQVQLHRYPQSSHAPTEALQLPVAPSHHQTAAMRSPQSETSDEQPGDGLLMFEERETPVASPQEFEGDSDAMLSVAPAPAPVPAAVLTVTPMASPPPPAASLLAPPASPAAAPVAPQVPATQPSAAAEASFAAEQETPIVVEPTASNPFDDPTPTPPENPPTAEAEPLVVIRSVQPPLRPAQMVVDVDFGVSDSIASPPKTDITLPAPVADTDTDTAAAATTVAETAASVEEAVVGEATLGDDDEDTEDDEVTVDLMAFATAELAEEEEKVETPRGPPTEADADADAEAAAAVAVLGGEDASGSESSDDDLVGIGDESAAGYDETDLMFGLGDAVTGDDV